MRLIKLALVVFAILLFGPRKPCFAAPQESDLRSKSIQAHYNLAVAADISTHTVLIDLNTAWPNPTQQTGAIKITGLSVQIDKTAASTATVRIGVINSINASTGSVTWFYELKNQRNVSNTNNNPIINTDNAIRDLTVIPPTPNTGADGTTPYLISNITTSASTIYQTDVRLPSPIGVAGTLPKLGDVVMNVINGTVAIDVLVDVLYHYDAR